MGEPLNFLSELDLNKFEDLSHLGRWRLSSYKGDHGLNRLLDNSPSTYWQSDGELPHYIEVQFSKLVAVSKVGLYIAPEDDSSYSPENIRVCVGFGRYDAVPVKTVALLGEKNDWACIDLCSDQSNPLKCMFLRIEILLNRLNGKDTHIRGVGIVGPRSKESEPHFNKSVGGGFIRL